MNLVKTTLLLALITGLLVAIGAFIGGIAGAAIFLVFAGALNFFAYWKSDSLALRMAGARQVTQAEEPQLFAMVDEVRSLAGMPMPKVYVIDTDTPNAFATGRNPEHAVVAVTNGIRRLLNERELRAVIGHEMGHVKNRDILTSSIVATVAGAISMIANMIMWTSLFGGGRDRNPLISIGIMILAPMAAMVIQLGISRTREFAADQTGAEITHDPEALANALLKLERGVEMIPMKDTPNAEAVSSLYIVHPFKGGAGMSGLFRTHPKTEDRVARLRKMTYGG